MSGWPPPVEESTVRAKKPIFAGGDWQVLELREVVLWAERVWFDDESGRVWCPGCKGLVDVEVLGLPSTNSHHVGLHADEPVRILPMRDDADDPPVPFPLGRDWIW